jgi:SAM-dependent methyltransferase
MTRAASACVAILAPLILLSAIPRAADRVVYTPFADVRSTLEALKDALPVDLRDTTSSDLAARWPAWAVSHDQDIRARLLAGDEDTIVNWLLLGRSFTTLPRAFVDVPAAKAQELSELIAARTRALVAAISSTTNDERRVFARAFFDRKGFHLQNAADRTRLEQYLLTAVVRVTSEQAKFADALQGMRRLRDQTEAFAERSKLFRDRGLSLDTSIAPSFALEQSLRELQRRGMLKPGVREVAVIGPGLDFSDKNSGYDFYPQQTLQPFALIDSLARLGLTSASPPVRLTTIDLSPRVNAHLRNAKSRAAAGSPYVLRVPIDGEVPWRPAFLAYWNALGDRIGSTATEANTSAPAGGVRIRTIRIRPELLSRLDVTDVDVVVQRLADRQFDLVVATNVFVYYDVLDQALALSNVASMLRPGGVLLSNNAIIELPGSAVRSVGYLTTEYSDRPDDGDHVVWYRRRE